MAASPISADEALERLIAGSVGWWKLELSSEDEYLFGLAGWSGLSILS